MEGDPVDAFKPSLLSEKEVLTTLDLIISNRLNFSQYKKGLGTLGSRLSYLTPPVVLSVQTGPGCRPPSDLGPWRIVSFRLLGRLHV